MSYPTKFDKNKSTIHCKPYLLPYRGYWTPKGGRVTEYRSEKNGHYFSVTGPRLKKAFITI